MQPEVHAALKAAPEWSLLVGDAGRGLVLCALVLFAASAVSWTLAPVVAGGRFERGLSRLGAWALPLGVACLLGAMASLMTLLATDQFQFRYVFNHNDRATAFAYKIAGAWGGQEGSFLLWACAGGLFGALAARRTGADRRWFTAVYAVFLAALAGILTYESPFVLMPIDGQILVPPDGRGMMPSLHNYWVTIHPPTIFLGFGSLTVPFAWAMAGLLRGDLDSWAKPVRAWAILSMTLLGLGLCMGGFWAYETLGWGGFWAWDPVENVSFVPWCLAVAFIHGLFVQAALGRWRYGNALLGGMGFLAFVYGTFMTRSGFLGDTSVHSFAEMDRSALRLLVGLMAAGFLSFLGVWAWRLIQARREPREAVPDEGVLQKRAGYGGAVWLMTAFAVATGMGMSVPLAMSLSGRAPKVVEEGLYHQVLSWFFVPTMLLMGVVPFLGWRAISLRQLWARLSTVLALSLGFLGLALFWIKSPWGVGMDPASTIEFPFGLQAPRLAWMGFLIWLCLFATVGNLWRLAELGRRAGISLGGLVTHLGLITALLGLILSRGFERSEQFAVQEARPQQALGYVVSYKGPTGDFRARDNKVLFELSGNGERFVARPGLYYRDGQNGELEPMAWPAIVRHPFYDVYFTLGAMQFEATEPLTFKVGEEKLVGDEILIKYEKMVREGEAGAPGARFGAHLSVTSAEGKSHVTPWLTVGANGPEFEPSRLTQDLLVFLQKMDAADKSVTIQLHWLKPQYPIELFYKPMTLLVWVGTGIMTLGGLMAALYRRRMARARETSRADGEPQPDADDAPLPVAQV